MVHSTRAITRYDITTINDTIDVEKADWLRVSLRKDQYRIVNFGFLIDCYEVEFTDPSAETLYLLRWG